MATAFIMLRRRVALRRSIIISFPRILLNHARPSSYHFPASFSTRDFIIFLLDDGPGVRWKKGRCYY
jgi:hypothetical protein